VENISERDIEDQEKELNLQPGILKTSVLLQLENLFNSNEVMRAFYNRDLKIIKLDSIKAKRVDTIAENKLKRSFINGITSKDSEKLFILSNDRMRFEIRRNLTNLKLYDSEQLDRTLDVCSRYLKESLDSFIIGKVKARRSKTYNYPDKKSES
jgi:hypothetical protein